jgi:uncharacterized Rmd1/YagE family protein
MALFNLVVYPMRCAAHTIGQEFQVKNLFSHLRSKYTVNRMREVFHVPYQEGADVFFFPYGPVVFWGLSEDQEQAILNEVRPFLQTIAAVPEEDTIAYSYGDKAKIQDDEIILPNQDIFSKLAYSHGLAQSGILGLFEETLHRTSHLTKSLPEELARNGNIKLSRKKMRRMMGQLYLDRSSINLHQELLDTPDFFWEYSDLEAMYEQIAHYMDIERRVNILNQRLGIVQELFDMLGNELNHQHSSQLEWAIIWLILIEVALSLMSIFNVFKH